MPRILFSSPHSLSTTFSPSQNQNPLSIRIASLLLPLPKPYSPLSQQSIDSSCSLSLSLPATIARRRRDLYPHHQHHHRSLIFRISRLHSFGCASQSRLKVVVKSVVGFRCFSSFFILYCSFYLFIIFYLFFLFGKDICSNAV